MIKPARKIFREINTPAYVLDEAGLVRNLEILADVQRRTGCKILLAQKAFSMFSVYPLIAKYLSGTTASGLYEAKLGREEFGGEVHCFIADEDVAAEARARGVTRSLVSMEKAARMTDKPLVFAIGNAPTALFSLCDLVNAGKLRPAVIIGVPVGFVNVVEAKEQVMHLPVPYIVARGRKGGSNVAAAIVNAAVYQLSEREE